MNRDYRHLVAANEAQRRQTMRVVFLSLSGMTLLAMANVSVSLIVHPLGFGKPLPIFVAANVAAAVVGVVCGTLIMPVQIALLRTKPLRLCVPVIYLPAVIVLIFHALMLGLAGSCGSFIIVTVVAMFVVIGMSIVCNRMLSDDENLIAPQRCPQCNYNLRGELSAGCPECGWGR